MISLHRLLTTQRHSPLIPALYYYEGIKCPLMLHQIVQSSPKLLAFKMLIALYVLLTEPAVPQMKEVSSVRSYAVSSCPSVLSYSFS